MLFSVARIFHQTLQKSGPYLQARRAAGWCAARLVGRRTHHNGRSNVSLRPTRVRRALRCRAIECANAPRARQSAHGCTAGARLPMGPQWSCAGTAATSTCAHTDGNRRRPPPNGRHLHRRNRSLAMLRRVAAAVPVTQQRAPSRRTGADWDGLDRADQRFIALEHAAGRDGLARSVQRRLPEHLRQG